MDDLKKRNLGSLLAPGWLLVFPLILFSRVLFFHSHTILASQDNSEQWYAWFSAAARWLHHGKLLLWDPYAGGGRSFVGEPQVGMFYPLNWLLFAAPLAGKLLNPWLLEWFIAIHFMIASLLQYACARQLQLSRTASVISAIVFAYGGWMVSTAFGYLGQFHSAVWLPGVLLFFLRAIDAKDLRTRFGSIVICSLCWAMSLLAGAISPPFQIGLILFAFTVWLSLKKRDAARTTLACFAIATVLFLCLSAVQLLPSWQYSRTALRWIGGLEPVDFTASISYQTIRTLLTLKPVALLGLVYAPYAYASNATYYVSFLALPWIFWAAISRRHWLCAFFGTILVVSWLYAIGQWSPITWLGYHLVPFIDRIRETERFMFTSNWALAGLAGFGIDELRTRLDIRSQLPALLTACFAALFVVLIVFGPSYASVPPKLLTVILLLGLSAIMVASGPFPPLARDACLVLFIAIDIAFYLWPAIPAIAAYDGTSNRWPGRHFESIASIAPIETAEGTDRVDGTNVVPRNFGDAVGMHGLQFYSNTAPAATFRALQLPVQTRDRLFDVASRVQKSETGLQTLETARFGHVRLFTKIEVLQNSTDVYHALSDPSMDVSARLLLTEAEWAKVPNEIQSAITNSRDGIPGEAHVVRFEPHEIRLSADTTVPALLWISEVYDPDWVALVDGKPVPVLNSDYCFRAIALTAGHHDVLFQYRPKAVLIGAAFSLFGLVVVAIGLAARFRASTS